MIIQKSNKVLLIAILMLSLFALTTNKSEAQCPTGYTFTNMTFTINGCVFSVPVCYKCGPTALDETDVKPITTFSYADTNCTTSPALTEAEILAEINLRVINRIYLAELCEVKPCGVNPKVRMRFAKYACWRSGSTKGKYDACTTEPYCDVLYEACNNGSSISWNVISSGWVGGTPSCPPPPTVWVPGNCYLLNSSCP